MLKYVDTKVVFIEVPDEITLAINISNCPCHCVGCHSPYLADDVGEELYVSTLSQLVNKNRGITCIAFMGGDSDPFEVNVLAKTLRDNTTLKTTWYSGRQELAKEIELKNFDFIKLGPFLGKPLNDPLTNQKFYEVCRVKKLPDEFILNDITYKFWKK